MSVDIDKYVSGVWNAALISTKHYGFTHMVTKNHGFDAYFKSNVREFYDKTKARYSFQTALMKADCVNITGGKREDLQADIELNGISITGQMRDYYR